jgi:hypothetical protein
VYRFSEPIEMPVSEKNIMMSTGEMDLMQMAETEVNKKEISKSADVRLLSDYGLKVLM